ncbi:MAG: hypothetical protein M9924_03580 [Rhizobiaceae bacterium]|nr:hypothetical protein [Rhizobiaceae bacterium]
MGMLQQQWPFQPGLDKPYILSARGETTMIRNLVWLALASALSTGASVAAEASPKTSFVREHAIALLEGALTPQQTTKLQLIAYQSAIADVCEGFTIDEAKFSKAFEALAPVEAANMDDNQKAYHDKHILVIFGVLVGGELNAMSDDPAGACEQASKYKVDPDIVSELVWQ